MRDSKPIPYRPTENCGPFPWFQTTPVASVKYDADLGGYMARRIGGGLYVGPAATPEEAFKAYDMVMEERRG